MRKNPKRRGILLTSVQMHRPYNPKPPTRSLVRAKNRALRPVRLRPCQSAEPAASRSTTSSTRLIRWAKSLVDRRDSRRRLPGALHGLLQGSDHRIQAELYAEGSMHGARTKGDQPKNTGGRGHGPGGIRRRSNFGFGWYQSSLCSSEVLSRMLLQRLLLSSTMPTGPGALGRQRRPSRANLSSCISIFDPVSPDPAPPVEPVCPGPCRAGICCTPRNCRARRAAYSAPLAPPIR
jgi:hypothetical protein